MIQCSLSELVRLSEIIRKEKAMAESYTAQCENCVDPQLREKLQKCAAIHAGNSKAIEGMFKE